MPDPLIPKKAHDVVTLAGVTGAAATAGTATTAVYLPRPANAVILVLDVTAAATDAGDTLDVAVQTKPDGANWVPVCSFTQVLGNGGAKRYVAKLSCTEPQAMFEAATSLAAGSVRHLIGDEWRINYVVVNTSTVDAAFTFGVTALVV